MIAKEEVIYSFNSKIELKNDFRGVFVDKEKPYKTVTSFLFQRKRQIMNSIIQLFVGNLSKIITINSMRQRYYLNTIQPL